MTHRILKRIIHHMPQYYSIPNWQKRGKVILIPRPFLRRLPILKHILPYHVGDMVKFCIRFDKPNPNDSPLTSHVLWEKLGDKWKPIENINAISTEVTGTRIHSTGDIVYCLGRPAYVDNSDAVFTAEVENWDAVFSKWVWAIVGMILSLLVGIILWALGVIQIIPHWSLFVK